MRLTLVTAGAVMVVLGAGCEPVEPEWQEGEIGESSEGLTVGGEGVARP